MAKWQALPLLDRIVITLNMVASQGIFVIFMVVLFLVAHACETKNPIGLVLAAGLLLFLKVFSVKHE